MFSFLLRYSIKELKMHKRRKLSIFLVLFLAFFLLAESLFLYHAYRNMQIQDAYDNAGYYHVHVKEIDEEQEQRLLSDDAVKRKGTGREYPFSDIADIETATKNSEIIFKYMDKDALSLTKPKLRCGRMPGKEEEIVVSACLKMDGEYLYNILEHEEAVTVCITFGKEEESFQVVGVLDDFNAGGDGTCSVIAYANQIAEPDEYYIEMIKADRTLIENYLENVGYDYGKEVYDTLNLKNKGSAYTGEYKVELNNRVLDALEGSGDKSVPAGIILGTAVAFILLAGGLMLWSTVSIGLEERIKDNALLRMIGFSPGMLIFYNILEISILFICALSAGIPAAIFLAGKTVEYAEKLRFTELSHIEMEVDVRGMVISAIMVYLLALCCVILPVAKYLKKSVSLMFKGESRTENYGSGKRGNMKWVSFGSIGFRMGCRQAFRRPGRTLSVILSIWAVLSLLLVYIVCLNVMQDRMENQEVYRSEFVLFGDGQVDTAAQMEKIPYVSWCEVHRQEFASFDNKSIRINDKAEGDDFYWMEMEEEDGPCAKIMVIGISKEYYRENYRPYDGESMPDYDTLVSERAGVIVDRFLSTSGEETCALDMEFPSTLKRIGGKNGISETKILARVMDTKVGMEAGITNPYIFMPQEVFLEDFEPAYTLIYFNVDDSHVHDFREWAVEHEHELLPLTDNASEYLEARDTKNMLQGILFVALVMMGCITLANLMNVFCANARMQRKDYAIMSALGMDALPMHMLVAGEAVVYTIGAVCLTGIFMLVGVKKLFSLLLQIELQLNAYLFFLLGMAGFASFSLCFLLGIISSYKNRKQPVVEVLRDDFE